MKKYFFWTFFSLILRHNAAGQAPLISTEQERLQGRWFQACSHGALKTEFFQGDKVTLTEMFFLKEDCSQPSVIFVNQGTYILSNGNLIDFQFTSIRLRLMNEIAVNDFNRRRVCDLANWTLGLEKEISGRSCEIIMVGLPQKIPTVGEMRYGIYRLQDPIHLSFGKLSRQKNATTPEKRPTDYDPRFYTKVPHIHSK
jgi:hypothetical protein